MSRTVSAPYRSRAKAELKLILAFRGTESPPQNIPMRLHVLDENMNAAFKLWILGFTFHHPRLSPPCHKARAPFVAVNGLTLAQICFNFRSNLL